MTSMQLAVAAGILLMTGPILLIAHYAPKHPALNAYLTAATHTPNILTETTIESDHWEDRLGLWLQRNLGGRLGVPKDELEILRVPIHKYLTRRALYALIGVSAPTLLSVMLWLMGMALPVGIPVIGSLALGIVLSFLPDLTVRAQAKEAREEFRYVLSSYMDLVSLERRGAASPAPSQAMTQAALIGDHWAFRRLGEEMAHSRLSGISPWERLKELGKIYQVPELAELGNIMKIAGQESASVYNTLAERSKAMRKAHLAREITTANEISTRRSIPMTLLGVVFMAALLIPGLLGLLSM